MPVIDRDELIGKWRELVNHVHENASNDRSNDSRESIKKQKMNGFVLILSQKLNKYRNNIYDEKKIQKLKEKLY